MTLADARRIAERAEPGRAFSDAEITAMLGVATALVERPKSGLSSLSARMRLVPAGRAA
jgi:hypothetical protein